MPKRKRNNLDSNRYENYEPEALSKSDYRPGVTIQNIPSEGRSTRLFTDKCERQHDTLSDLETRYLYYLERADLVTDIREQYLLLPIEQTELIAAELGVKHSTNPKTKEHTVMSTDFLITICENGVYRQLARTVKPTNKITKRQIEKFEIERRFWEMKGVDWGIVTEREINKDVAFNLCAIRPFIDVSSLEVFEGLTVQQINIAIDRFKEAIINRIIIVRDFCNSFDQEMKLKPGSGVSIYKHLLAKKEIFFDITQKINTDKPIKIEEYKKYKGV